MSRTSYLRGAEKFNISGVLQLVVKNHQTGRSRRHVMFNTITYDGSNSPLFLWAPDGITVADWAFNELRFGTSGAPPTRGDISLGAPLGGGPTGGIVSIASGANRVRSEATGEVLVSAVLDINHGNGSNLCEVGIFFANGRIGMHQVFPVIPKTIAITVSVNWRIACVTP